MYTIKMSEEGSYEEISSLVLLREAKHVEVVKEDV